jgi:hypothetical protein
MAVLVAVAMAQTMLPQGQPQLRELQILAVEVVVQSTMLLILQAQADQALSFSDTPAQFNISLVAQ